MHSSGHAHRPKHTHGLLEFQYVRAFQSRLWNKISPQLFLLNILLSLMFATTIITASWSCDGKQYFFYFCFLVFFGFLVLFFGIFVFVFWLWKNVPREKAVCPGWALSEVRKRQALWKEFSRELLCQIMVIFLEQSYEWVPTFFFPPSEC